MALRWTGRIRCLDTALELLRGVLHLFPLQCLYFGAVESVLLCSYGRPGQSQGVITSTSKCRTLRAAAVLPLRTRAPIFATNHIERVRRMDS